MPAVPNAEAYAHANRFAGRAVLITGAASGFGRATAVQFAKHGANLVLGDVDAKGLQETVGMVEREGG
jgi:NAD(P)-dependent dehydrogenase (short-subunit alcohol dehydrogenase family)